MQRILASGGESDVTPATSAADLLASGDIAGLLAAHRATFGDLRMEDPPAPPTPTPTPTPAAPPTPTPTPDVPQDQVNAIVSRTKRETEAETRAAVAQALGVDIEEATKLVKASKDAEAAQLTEAQKREQAAQEAERKATERETAAAAKERTATIRTALVEAGCTAKDDLTDAVRLVELADGDVTDEAATAAVDALKKRRPELFKATTTPRPAGAPPAGAPAPTGGGPTSMAEARERAREKLGIKSA